MFKTLIHTSENDNLYIYNHQSKLSILVHPDFRKAYEGSADADPYYIKKYEYLKKHNFFSTVDPVNFGKMYLKRQTFAIWIVRIAYLAIFMKSLT